MLAWGRRTRSPLAGLAKCAGSLHRRLALAVQARMPALVLVVVIVVIVLAVDVVVF